MACCTGLQTLPLLLMYVLLNQVQFRRNNIKSKTDQRADFFASCWLMIDQWNEVKWSQKSNDDKWCQMMNHKWRPTTTDCWHCGTVAALRLLHNPSKTLKWNDEMMKNDRRRKGRKERNEEEERGTQKAESCGKSKMQNAKSRKQKGRKAKSKKAKKGRKAEKQKSKKAKSRKAEKQKANSKTQSAQKAKSKKQKAEKQKAAKQRRTTDDGRRKAANVRLQHSCLLACLKLEEGGATAQHDTITSGMNDECRMSFMEWREMLRSLLLAFLLSLPAGLAAMHGMDFAISASVILVRLRHFAASFGCCDNMWQCDETVDG